MYSNGENKGQKSYQLGYACAWMGQILFWRAAVNIFIFLSVYDMIVLLEWNCESLMKWAVLEMLFVCLCPHRDIAHASVCVLQENARLCHPFIKRYDRIIWVNVHQIA